jgi:hypothetical protein
MVASTFRIMKPILRLITKSGNLKLKRVLVADERPSPKVTAVCLVGSFETWILAINLLKILWERVCKIKLMVVFYFITG